GLVPQVYGEKDLEQLEGHIAIGHNRYSTSGGSFHEHTQPFIDDALSFALAHNGNLPKVDKLISFLKSKKIPTERFNDSGLMHAAILYYLRNGASLQEAITKTYPLFTGAFSLLVMTKDTIAAVRDPYGIRPFCF